MHQFDVVFTIVTNTLGFDVIVSTKERRIDLASGQWLLLGLEALTTVDYKTTEAGAKWMARALNLGGATTNVK